MGDPAFLITRDPEVRTSPAAARERLRTDGFATFAEAVKAAGQADGLIKVSFGTVTIADDAVCMMIGNTPELVSGCEKAWNAGHSELEAADRSPLSVYYHRYKVSPIQTDTILMVGSLSGYWAGVNPFGNGWSQPNPFTAVSTLYFFDEDSAARTNLRNIPEALRWIKHQEG